MFYMTIRKMIEKIFHPVAKRSGEPRAEAAAAIEEGGEGKGAAGGASPKGVRVWYLPATPAASHAPV